MAEIIPHWLTKQADLAPDKTALELADGTVYTFHELKEKSQSFARKLKRLGVQKESKIGILSANHPDMVIAIHAVSYVGAVAVLLNTRLTSPELDFQIKDAGVELVIGQDEYNKVNADFYTFSDAWKVAESSAELQTEINLDASFTIIYTSGTTGFPKGVIHTYGNHWWSATGSMLNLGLANNDKWLAVLPLFHVSGLSILLRSVICGISVHLHETYEKQAVHHAIMNRDVTIASVVTVMLKDLVGCLGNSRYPETFRCMLLGGGPAPKSLLEQAKERNMPVFQSYGLTETASQIVTLSPADALQKLGSSGKPLFPAQLKIDKTDGAIGEILVKGPMVTKGYYNNREATEKVIADGWLATGDLGYTDEEGFLYVADRRKDLIISGGENIYPTEIEGVLAAMEAIDEVGVTGKKDDKWGQIPVAFVVVNDTSITTEAIMEFAAQRLAGYKLPKEIYFVEKLPRNASNKLMRNKLLQQKKV
ncbi:o-succinylbenzoate--CoA ligase [Lentibacillus cibarius]|uniref:2-succinylbenzoate--CoA ligase n=1 Tax=Lentibacillus cibarius TaxID=2583219 RepID=A0A549YMB4_9BACI|nr:o-succinylbenzoate--CoA ligase [Lentibacillus cibarius]TRM13014.1 o-succinylbenzoate--CoA ligase [Lentibacillus cibarius]